MLKRKMIVSCLAATLCFSTALVAAPTPTEAASIAQVADELMRQHPDIIKRWTDAGVSEAQVKEFVNDVAKRVEASGGVTESNIGSKFRQAVRNAMPSHMQAVAAAAIAFDIDLNDPQIPREFESMRDIIKDAILGADDSQGGSPGAGSGPGGGSGGGSGGGGGAGNGDANEDNEKDADEKEDENKNEDENKGEEVVDPDPTPQPSPTPVFSDIAGHWAEQEMIKMYNAGIVKGTDGKALPNESITRAEFATLLVNALGLTASSPMTFADANPDAWYYEPLSKAVHAGLLKGYSADRVGPNDTITREQMATMVYAAMKMKGVPINTLNELSFKDKDEIAAWAREAVVATNAAGIINGFPDGTFDPRGQATRAQAIVMISKLMDL